MQATKNTEAAASAAQTQPASILGPAFTVKTEQDRFLEKLKRKQERKARRNGNANQEVDGGADIEKLSLMDAAELARQEHALRQLTAEELPMATQSTDFVCFLLLNVWDHWSYYVLSNQSQQKISSPRQPERKF